MFLTDEQLIRPFYLFESEFLAHCCTKGKSEKILLFYYSFKLSRILFDEVHELQTEFEKKYNQFLGSEKQILGNENADMVLSNIDKPERIFAVFEAKHYYTFDYDKTEINSDIYHDITKISTIRYNLFGEEVKRYFILFLAHYAEDRVDDNLRMYGRSYNSRVISNDNHRRMLQNSKHKFTEYIQSLNSDKLHLRIISAPESDLGEFEGLPIILTTVFVEVL